MNASVKVFTNVQMASTDFAILMDAIVPYPNGKGVLVGCQVSKSDASTLAITEGWAIVRGRLVHVTSGTISVVHAQTTTTKHVVLKVELSNTDNPGQITVETSVGEDSEDFNQTLGTAYLELATFTDSTSDISSVTNTAPTGSRHIFVSTSTPGENDGNDGDLWFVYSNS